MSTEIDIEFAEVVEIAALTARLAQAERERDEFEKLYKQADWQRVEISKAAFEAFGNNGLIKSWKEQVEDLKSEIDELKGRQP